MKLCASGEFNPRARDPLFPGRGRPICLGALPPNGPHKPLHYRFGTLSVHSRRQMMITQAAAKLRPLSWKLLRFVAKRSAAACLSMRYQIDR